MAIARNLSILELGAERRIGGVLLHLYGGARLRYHRKKVVSLENMRRSICV